KGFEGDLILNGFSEHFRNLLLSRDSTLTRLIDLPEEWKQRYFQHARIAGQAYLISALSILNDAELKYRTALNKRLHVEMTLIRLCYLNDWLEPDASALSSAGGAAEKKKPVARDASRDNTATSKAGGALSAPAAAVDAVATEPVTAGSPAVTANSA